MNNDLKYNKVYDFTNENVACLKKLYNFKNSKVLSVVGSGDQYFASILNGAKKIDLFDVNPTSYLYFLLKFYSIRELTYEEFYDLLVLKNFSNIKTYIKLENVLPIEVLNYYKYLIFSKNDNFRKDGVNLLTKSNQNYYFRSFNPVIPYFKKNCYYELQKLLKETSIPKFIECNILNLKNNIDDSYDIMILSNIYNFIILNIDEYTKLLKEFDCPEIQACYDWYGSLLKDFTNSDYSYDIVKPSSPTEYSRKENFVYTLRK